MKNREDTAAIFARLQTAHDDQVINSHELGVLLNMTRGWIHQVRHFDPQKLPPPLQLHSRRLVWRLGTVRAWVRSLPTDSSLELVDKGGADVSPAATRRPGRRRNEVKGPFTSGVVVDGATVHAPSTSGGTCDTVTVKGPCTHDRASQTTELS